MRLFYSVSTHSAAVMFFRNWMRLFHSVSTHSAAIPLQRSRGEFSSLSMALGQTKDIVLDLMDSAHVSKEVYDFKLIHSRDHNNSQMLITYTWHNFALFLAYQLRSMWKRDAIAQLAAFSFRIYLFHVDLIMFISMPSARKSTHSIKPLSHELGSEWVS